jgi:hypothetical protein
VKTTVAIILLAFALPLAAQTAHEDLLTLQDNSFLLEEAYNQDPGVVQHIGAFTRGENDAWEFAFTQEWPLHGLKHQWSYTVPVNDDGLGDIELNYRYQLTGDAEADLAIAPRFSVILPTGDDSETGLSVGLPISYVLAPRLATHTNLDVTWQDGTDWSIGQSLVYAPSGKVHLLVEAVYDHEADDLIVSPGVRAGWKSKSGWMIVPGLALPFGEENAVILYLSFER